MAAVEVESLTKRYGERLALDEVSLRVEPGECLALLGPNGAGKSTLVDVLATIQQPTSGRARVAGADVTQAPHEVRERVGVAFQRPITHDHLSAREIVLHQARLYAVPRGQARRRAEELLSFVGLGDRADERVSAYSEGMKRRADLARVLVTEPDVLLLDEPAAGLDPRGRRSIRQRLADLVQQGTTVILATHQMTEARELADRVAILHEGQVRAIDTPRALTEALGEHVVRVDLHDSDQASRVRDELASLGVETVRSRPRGVEAVLSEADVRPAQIVDALDEADVGYEEVAVHRPDLSDVFLDVTGDPLEPDEPREVPA